MFTIAAVASAGTPAVPATGSVNGVVPLSGLCVFRVSSSRRCAGTRPPAIGVSPAEYQPSTSTITCNVPAVPLRMSIIPSVGSATSVEFAIVWPAAKFTVDVPGSTPSGNTATYPPAL